MFYFCFLYPQVFPDMFKFQRNFKITCDERTLSRCNLDHLVRRGAAFKRVCLIRAMAGERAEDMNPNGLFEREMGLRGSSWKSVRPFSQIVDSLQLWFLLHSIGISSNC